MQHSPRHTSERFDQIYGNPDYLSGDPNHGCPQVEDFPAQNVRQKCRDYAGRKHKATIRTRSSVTGMDADLWAKCNKLLRAEKKLSKLFITSTCIHVIALVFVTISTVNLAREKSNFRLFWIDMQRGYFSLLLENYSPQVYSDQKYVYSSLVERLSSQEQVVDRLKYAFNQFDNIMNTSLTRISKTTDDNGDFNYPQLCVTNRPAVNLNEVYAIKLDQECTDVFDDDDIDEFLDHSLSSTVLISMNFKFKQIYLIEGFKPVCIQIDVDYTIQNDFQYYLWPVMILAKGELTSCSEDSEEKDFLPIKNLGFFITTGAVTVTVCVIGCFFHLFRLMTFFKIGKIVRDYATKNKLSKPLWSCWPQRIQGLFWWRSPEEREKYANMPLYIPLKAYLIFCPLLHILDIIFLLLAICGVVLVFTLLRSATTTDELISYSTSVSFVLGLCSIYFWCTSFRLLNYSKLAGVTIRSLLNSKATRSIFAAVVIASFGYIGIVLFAWVLLGIFHPNFSTFRLSAESFYSLLFGDEVITIFDGIIPEQTQFFVFVVSRVIIPIYGLLFPILLLSVVIAIVSVAAEQKYLRKDRLHPNIHKPDIDGMLPNGKFTWRVLLEWATAPEPRPFPGTDTNSMEQGSYESYDHAHLPPRSRNNTYLEVMNSRANLTAHEQPHPDASFTGVANSSECSSMQLSTRSENYCYGHQGLKISAPVSQRSSVTIDMTQKGANEMATDSKISSHSLQLPMTDHPGDAHAPQIIPHTQAIGIIFTTSTGDETNV